MISRFASPIKLVLCLWLAFFLRVWGLDFGLPYEFHPDERQYVNLALDWHTTGQMELRFVNPPLFVYVLLVAYWFWLALSPFTPSAEWITTAYTFARLWSVAFGVMTVALAYPLGRRLTSRKAGLVSMILLAGLFLPARESHFAVNDTAVTFFVLLAIYFSLVLLQNHQTSKASQFWLKLGVQNKQLSDYLAAGIAVGLAAASKLTGGAVVLALLVAHFLGLTSTANYFSRDLLKPKSNQYLGWSLLAALVTYLLISAHIFWQFPRFIDTMAKHLQFGSEGYKGLQMAPSNGWAFYIYALGWGMGWTMLVVALVVEGIVLWRRHLQGLVLAIFPLALFAYMGGQKILFARFLLPAIPPLVILVAMGIVWLETSQPFFRRYQSLMWPLVMGILLVQPLTNLIWFDHLLTLPDTRQLATDWVSQNFPEDTVITKESYSILPTTFYIDSHWPYKIIHIDERGPSRNDPDHYIGHKTEIIALSNFTFARVRADPRAENARRTQLAFLEKKATLIKIFNPYHQSDDPDRQADYDDWFYLDQLYGPAAETWQRTHPGPLIKLYQLPYQNQPHTMDLPDIAVPIKANFGGKMILLGYDLPVRRVDPGGGLPLTLYWQADSRMAKTYIIFNHLLDSQQNNWGGYDRWPRETSNTVLWLPGEVVIDTFNVPVAADAPDGIYTIDIGLYDQADPAASPLPIISNGVPVDQNSVRIGPVKVGRASSSVGLVSAEVNPQVPMSIKLGHPPVILLRGYDLIEADNHPTQNLKLILYWESLAQTSVNWSIFTHLRNQNGETVAQKDGPAGGQAAYPASLWDAGEIIADEIVVPVPADLPSGKYSLVVGLYNLRDGTRLMVPDSADNEIVLTKWERYP